MKKYLPLLLLFTTIITSAQDFSGKWEGILTQPGKTDTFLYEINITQKNQSISGTSFSRSLDGKSAARFVITGVWDGMQLVLQEIEQTEPKQPRWCLKYALLKYTKKATTEEISGDWKANGCTPGKLFLQRQRIVKEGVTNKPEPFTWTGRWTGQLSQSDRDYGFYYDFNLNNGGVGQSYIVSEDNGGSANHNLQWTFNKKDSTLIIKELEVVNKTDSNWKWCIKSAALRLRHNANVYTLEGDWQGYLEGHTEQTGKCASGKLYIEKPITTQQTQQLEQQQTQVYQAETQREVRVSRVIEVQKPNIRLNVWDSGTVDGDVVTIFLNGRQILDKYRVSKSKTSILVTLNEDNNYIILHAEDLGSIPPNTIAVSVDDGVKEQMLVLSSDLKVSGAVLVKQFSVKDNRR